MDFFNDMFGQGSSKLHEKREKFVVGELDDENLFETVEETYLEDGQGPKTERVSKVGLAGCGHYVGFQSPRELRGRCAKCHATLCYQCSAAKCNRCHITPLCPKCSKPINGITFCRKCRIIIFLQAFISIGFRKFHSLFSREIS